jgi:hypothetical protein
LIDTRKGLVLGRWHFPSEISGLRPEGATVDVEIRIHVSRLERKGDELSDAGSFVTRHVRLDPEDPHVPFWPDGNLMRYRIPFYEAQNAFPSIDISGIPTRPKTSAQEAARVLPELREMVRRDPFTPWFGVALGRVLKDIGDPSYTAAIQGALNSAGTDFSELLPISASLEGSEEHELARAAFERGYRNFWERGNDPRLFLTLIGAITLYRPYCKELGDPSTEAGREIVENLYRLMPYCEGAELAWRLYANYWRDKGQTDQARLWLARADDARGRGPFNWWRAEGSGVSLNVTLLVVPAAVLSILIYWLVLFLRYWPQRRLDSAAKRRVVEPPSGFVLSKLGTWSPIEQIGLLASVVVFWVLGFRALGPATEDVPIVWRCFFAVYYVIPVVVLYFLFLYIWHRLRPAAKSGDEDRNSGTVPRHWLDERRWGWPRRLGLLVAVLAAGTYGYFKLTWGMELWDHYLAFSYAAFVPALLYLFVGGVYDRVRRRLAGVAVERTEPLRRGLVILNTLYWSRAERFSFFSIVFVLWLTAGLSGLYLDGLLRRAASPIGAALGNFGGPESIAWLESDWLPPSPYRDLFLAFAYQQDGQGEKAERIYRTLPQFAESWNNLGVILKGQGKDAEAKQAFEKALQIDPSLSEATLNFGRPPVDLWTELHQKYLPGQPMLAPPRENQWRQLFLGGSGFRVYVRALLGPFSVQDPAGLFGLMGKLF